MDVGLTTGISTHSIDVAVLAQKAESLGFESFWLPEHTIVPVHLQLAIWRNPRRLYPPIHERLGRSSDWLG